MKEIENCLVCSSREHLEYLPSCFSGSVDEAANYFLSNRKAVVHGRIVQCSSCGFRFTNPQFEPDEYHHIYSLAEGHSSDLLREAQVNRFRRLARFVSEDVPSKANLFDFGCGDGGFLKELSAARKTGFDVGSPHVVETADSVLYYGEMSELMGTEPFTDGSFDTITAIDVFEHIPSLDATIEMLRSLLATGGHLVVTVPDRDSWAARLSGRKWNMILLEHLWYFNRDNLRSLMERFGFRETAHRSVPYDTSMAHLMRRVTQTYKLPYVLNQAPLPKVNIPLPIGIMYSAFQRI
jgi:SAM-dependent methyltransferase